MWSLPEGLYIVRIESVTPDISNVKKEPMWKVAFVPIIEGHLIKDYYLWGFYVDTPPAAWAWAQFGINNFSDMPNLVGHRFMVRVTNEWYEGIERSRINRVFGSAVPINNTKEVSMDETPDTVGTPPTPEPGAPADPDGGNAEPAATPDDVPPAQQPEQGDDAERPAQPGEPGFESPPGSDKDGDGESDEGLVEEPEGQPHTD